MQKGLIGLDLGTTTVKAVLMDEQGTVLASSSREYALETTGEWCEIEAESYWTNSLAAIKEILEKAPIKADDIRGISFSSQGETLICLDKQGIPVRKAIVWLDNRSNAEGQEIWDFFGREAINKTTGQTEMLPFWTASRILWLKKHEPVIFQKIDRFLLVEDYIIFRLTGQYATDQSLNSSTVYFDIFKKRWWREMLAFLMITESQLPIVYPSGACISFISASAAKATGLPPTLKVVAGTFDHVAGAIGAGNIRAGLVSETTGASMAMVITLDEPIENIPVNLPIQAHAITGKYLLLPYAQTAGMMFRWFRDTFCAFELRDAADQRALEWIEAAGQQTKAVDRQTEAANQQTEAADQQEDAYALLAAAAAGIAPGSEGLLVLPHLMGSGSPEFNVKAKAVFAGITLGMTRAHFTRAIMESIAYMIKRNLETLELKGIRIAEIRVLGGGAKSSLWNQIKADVLDLPIYTLQGQETTSIGAAILAGVGCGIFASIEEGCQKTVAIKEGFSPVATHQAVYKKQYEQYKLLSDTLETFW